MRQSKRGLPGKALPSVDWKRLRGRRASPEARAAYHERRLELEVAATIHKLRLRRGLSQEELARRLGTKQSAIARLEGAGENISISRLQRIASLLGAELRIELKTTAA